MEYTQWAIYNASSPKDERLNPCCNGIYSMRITTNKIDMEKIVLILVVMEYTQWARYNSNNF